MGINKLLTQELNEFKQKLFNRLSITDRVITLNGKNFNFENGWDWPLDVAKRGYKSSDEVAEFAEEQKTD